MALVGPHEAHRLQRQIHSQFVQCVLDSIPERDVDSVLVFAASELGEDSLESDVSGATSQNASEDAALLKQLREMAAKRLDRSR